MAKGLYDLFLCHTPADSGVASLVERTLTEDGLQVFRSTSTASTDSITNQMLGALLEANAVVVVMTRAAAQSPNIAFELGAAMSWQKPVYVLLDGVKAEDLFTGVKRFHVSPIDELPQLAAALKQGIAKLSDKDRERLARAYQEVNVPTDRLVRDPLAIDLLSHRFTKLGGPVTSGEKLVSELMRLRKTGRLPRLRRDKVSRTAPAAKFRGSIDAGTAAET